MDRRIGELERKLDATAAYQSTAETTSFKISRRWGRKKNKFEGGDMENSKDKSEGGDKEKSKAAVGYSTLPIRELLQAKVDEDVFVWDSNSEESSEEKQLCELTLKEKTGDGLIDAEEIPDAKQALEKVTSEESGANFDEIMEQLDTGGDKKIPLAEGSSHTDTCTVVKIRQEIYMKFFAFTPAQTFMQQAPRYLHSILNNSCETDCMINSGDGPEATQKEIEGIVNPSFTFNPYAPTFRPNSILDPEQDEDLEAVLADEWANEFGEEEEEEEEEEEKESDSDTELELEPAKVQEIVEAINMKIEEKIRFEGRDSANALLGNFLAKDFSAHPDPNYREVARRLRDRLLVGKSAKGAKSGIAAALH